MSRKYIVTISGEMSEWLKETVSKTVIAGNCYPGFESLSLRLLLYALCK